MWKWGGSAPSAKRAFRDQICPNVQKAMLLGSPSHQGLKNCGIPQNIFFIFLFFGDFLPFSCCWPYFEAGMLFGGFSSTRVTKSNSGLMENPYSEKLADLWQIWPYSRYRGPDSHMQSGASPESSVGDAHDWILFLWFILIVFCPWFRSATSHPVQNTQNHRFFDPKHHFLTHERQKNKKSIFCKSPQFSCPMMRGIAEWHVFIPNEAFLVAKSALGPRGAKPPHIHMTQENQPIFSK